MARAARTSTSIITSASLQSPPNASKYLLPPARVIPVPLVRACICVTAYNGPATKGPGTTSDESHRLCASQHGVPGCWPLTTPAIPRKVILQSSASRHWQKDSQTMPCDIAYRLRRVTRAPARTYRNAVLPDPALPPPLRVLPSTCLRFPNHYGGPDHSVWPSLARPRRPRRSGCLVGARSQVLPFTSASCLLFPLHSVCFSPNLRLSLTLITGPITNNLSFSPPPCRRPVAFLHTDRVPGHGPWDGPDPCPFAWLLDLSISTPRRRVPTESHHPSPADRHSPPQALHHRMAVQHASCNSTR